MPSENTPTRAGLVAIVGRPNVGKSTLTNALVGDKVSIVTPKPQTTRHRIVGVLTRRNLQIGLVDTPGLHRDDGRALNRVLNETATASLAGVDAVLMVVEAGQWRDDDERVLQRLARQPVPVGLLVNKVDRLANPSAALPFMQECAARHDFAFIVPGCARSGDNLEPIVDELDARMPAGEFLFPADEISDRSLRFLVAEIVREKLMLALQQELPYALAVAVESYVEDAHGHSIHAVIWVARPSHKGMVIGRGGKVLKQVGSAARRELLARLDGAVDLRLWVKVREGWTDSEAAVRELGH